MNKIFLIGNLTRDPELMQTRSGVSVSHLSLAVTRQYADQDGEKTADFFNCTAWRGVADTVCKYCKKGDKVAITGNVQIDMYTDKNGEKRPSITVVINDIEFLTTKNKAAPIDSRLEEIDDDGSLPF